MVDSQPEALAPSVETSIEMIYIEEDWLAMSLC